jgi:pentose-5-phosphate-3-epimerase
MIEVIPDNTCPADYPELVRRSKALAQFSKNIHFDLSDGKFTAVTSWPYGEGQMAELEKMADRREYLPLAKITYYEAHMMVEEPLRVGTLLARIGCRRVVGHLETFASAHAIKEAFSAWRAGGAEEVGLALLIDTPLSELDAYASECDTVYLMSIKTLGRQGAPFTEAIYERIEELHKKYPDLTIAIDGGVSDHNIKQLADAGATRFSVGSAITKTADPASSYEHLRRVATGSI